MKTDTITVVIQITEVEATLQIDIRIYKVTSIITIVEEDNSGDRIEIRKDHNQVTTTVIMSKLTDMHPVPQCNQLCSQIEAHLSCHI